MNRVFQPKAMQSIRLYSSALTACRNSYMPLLSSLNDNTQQPKSFLYAGAAVACIFTAATGKTSRVLRAESLSSLSKPLSPEVILYQYEPCPYCCKVKAVLDFCDVPYTVIEVNPLSKKETKFTSYNKVPIAMVNGLQINGSSEIISAIQRLKPNPTQDTEKDDAWQQWVNDKFITLMPPNIYQTIPESLASFDYLLTQGNFGTFERRTAKYVGAAAMYLISKRLKKRHGIENPRESLYAAVNYWLQEVGENPFLGGEVPSLTDVSVFGVLRSIHDLQTFEDVMAQTDLLPWYNRMELAVGASTRIVVSEESDAVMPSNTM